MSEPNGRKYVTYPAMISILLAVGLIFGGLGHWALGNIDSRLDRIDARQVRIEDKVDDLKLK